MFITKRNYNKSRSEQVAVDCENQMHGGIAQGQPKKHLRFLYQFLPELVHLTPGSSRQVLTTIYTHTELTWGDKTPC